ncbi:MAG: aldolase/citrate lyase family protein, partial [Pseudomonadota bacterium]
MSARPYRSVLYIPGSKERALEKAKTLPVDAIIFDLEDAVAVEEKANARALLAETLSTADYGGRAKIVRVNALDTEWGHADVEALKGVGADALLLPKVDSAEDVQALAELAPGVAIWAMMETPLGILNAAQIAAHPALEGFVLGTNDLAKDLNTRGRADREPLLTSLQMCMLAARAHGV